MGLTSLHIALLLPAAIFISKFGLYINLYGEQFWARPLWWEIRFRACLPRYCLWSYYDITLNSQPFTSSSPSNLHLSAIVVLSCSVIQHNQIPSAGRLFRRRFHPIWPLTAAANSPIKGFPENLLKVRMGERNSTSVCANRSPYTRTGRTSVLRGLP